MTIDELLAKLIIEEQGLRDQAYSCMQQADMIGVRIEGIREGHAIAMAARPATNEVSDEREAGHSEANQPIPESVAKKRGERRNIRELVYAKLAGTMQGMTADELISTLDAAKVSVVGALAYHEAKGSVQSENGLWFASQAAQTNGEDSAQDEPLSVVDAIRAAGEEGTTEDELWNQGYAAIAIKHALAAGEVEQRLGRLYSVGD
jgi:hypothetical protein